MGVFKSYKDKLAPKKEQKMVKSVKDVNEFLERKERERLEQLRIQMAKAERIKEIFSRVIAIDPDLLRIEDILKVDNERLFIHDSTRWRSIQIAVLSKDEDCDAPPLWRTAFGPYIPKLDMKDKAIDQFLEVLHDFYDEF